MDPGLQMEMLKPFGGLGHKTMTIDGESRLRREGAGQCYMSSQVSTQAVVGSREVGRTRTPGVVSKASPKSGQIRPFLV